MSKLAVFSSREWVHDAFDKENSAYGFEITYLESRLNENTVVMAEGYDAVCVFVNDTVNAIVLEQLHSLGVKLVALRCAGYNNVDIDKAKELDIGIVRVPAYSPYAVAEHTVGLILTLNRKYHKAYNRVRESNFALDGLMGFDLHGKVVGVVGTGKIGGIFADIMAGFGTKVIAYDKYPNQELIEKGVDFLTLENLYRSSDIISLHCPLTPDTHHLIDKAAMDIMKEGVMIINTSRGPLIDTQAVIRGLKSAKIGSLGIDVYEEEQDLFFEDLSQEIIQDDLFARLQTFPNVLITAHQAFFTKEAVANISETTFGNIDEYLRTGTSKNKVKPRQTM